ncbi:DUF3800 domain-containing protein [Thalassospiraceae bacterium LMO-JJ14]|nr:DUF3800 domain-containing protein [Thalassospiraceae bacterium LMO-JJ14]
MYIMYVDESGDSGLQNSPTSHFALSGIVVHESDWRSFIDTLVQFKKTMRGVYGLPVRAEIHASEFMKSRVHGMAKHVRFAILRNFLDELAKIQSINVTNVIIDKTNKPANYDVFTTAWQYLFQRFENTLINGNFPGGHSNDHGMVITDATNGTKLMRLMRRMAVHNYIPNMAQYGQGSRNIPITKVIEDPHGKDSSETLPIQAADVCAYFLMQHYSPNSFIRRKGAKNYVSRLQPILNTHARIGHPLGIVYI